MYVRVIDFACQACSRAHSDLGGPWALGYFYVGAMLSFIVRIEVSTPSGWS